MTVAKTIKKWYYKLGFPQEYDVLFENALAEYKINAELTIDKYDIFEKDGKRNLLSFLFFCEKLQKKYKDMDIDEEILYDTLSDIVYWTVTWSKIKKELYLGELNWLKDHFKMNLFKLGRLQFCMSTARQDVPEKFLVKGDPIIDIHIPAVGPLNNEECMKSINTAKRFFGKYFPEYKYKAFVCHSWLLDPGLKKMLHDDTNIIKFQNLFHIVGTDTSDMILKFIFGWDVDRTNVESFVCTSKFSQVIKEKAICGEPLYQGYGVLDDRLFEERPYA